jgi:hypothetical protein
MENNFNNEQEVQQPVYQQPVNPQPTEDTSVMTTGQWVLTTFLLALPCVGLILAIVWAFGDGNVNKKNYCRAWLIWYVVGIVLSVVVYAIMGAAMAGIFAALEGSMY